MHVLVIHGKPFIANEMKFGEYLLSKSITCWPDIVLPNTSHILALAQSMSERDQGT